MKRKITAWLLAALLLFCLLPLSALADSQPLLYRVTDENGSEIYLFGTIHVGNEALYPLSGQVLSAMDACDILAVEVDLVWEMEHPEELLKYAMDIYYTDDTRAEDALGMELVEQAADALGMDKRLVNGMKPYAILSLLEEKAVSDALLSSDLGVDQYLIRRAREKGMEVRALETLEEQFSLLHSMSNALTGYQMMLYASYPEQAALSTLQLLDAWNKGDRAMLIAMLESEDENMPLPQELRQEFESFNRKMYGDRDAAFVEMAQNFLKQDEKVFFAVGAAHVAGTDGMADQLGKLGYTVEEIGR
ncbi:MAG: TraB/GumN family protein [Clostridia bacterium]|nr:TraB/GumN family protein [Clostridia bacterium]